MAARVLRERSMRQLREHPREHPEKELEFSYEEYLIKMLDKDLEFDWTRYWYPVGTEDDLTLFRPTTSGEGGFLLDPEKYSFLQRKCTHITYDWYPETRLTVLLGEPGMGKTHELKRLRDDLNTSEENVHVNLLQLINFEDEDELRRELREYSGLGSWAEQPSDNSSFYVLLDGLDETGINLRSCLHAVDDVVDETQRTRCQVYLSCRSFDWKWRHGEGEISGVLREFWPNEPKILQLAPLRRCDAETAAESVGLDADTFIANVKRRGIVSLARNPKALRFLLKEVNEGGGQFPKSRARLYQKGSLRLAEEENTERETDSNLRSSTTARQRFLLAGRIAAALRLSARRSYCTGGSEGSDVTFATVEKNRKDQSTISGRRMAVEVTKNAIDETLDTGLFRSLGENRFKFEHASTGDFLAAWYIHDKLEDGHPNRLKSLLRCPDGTDVIPVHLQGVAGWLATFNEDAFEMVLTTAPEDLLRGDLITIESRQREKVVEELLKRSNQLELHLRDETRLEFLKHDGLAAQLRGWIERKTVEAPVRSLVIRLALACEVQELSRELLEIALDDEQSNSQRVLAIRAVARLGTEEDIEKLRELALPTDSRDAAAIRVRRAVIRCLYPEPLSLEELLDVVVFPDDINNKLLFPFFSLFGGLFEPADLITAMKWLTEQIDHSPARLSRNIGYLGARLFTNAWQELDEGDVSEHLAELVAAWLISDHPPARWQPSSLADNDRPPAVARRRFFSALIDRLTAANAETSKLETFVDNLDEIPLDGADGTWLAEKLEASSDETRRNHWLKLFECWARNSPDVTLQEFADQMERSSLGAYPKVRGILQKIEDSKTHAREQHYWREGDQAVEDVRQRLRQDESPSWTDLFWKLWSDEEFHSTWGRIEGLLENAESDEKDHFVTSAENHLLKYGPSGFLDGDHNEQLFLGPFALMVVHDHGREGLDSLGNETLERWLPIFIAKDKMAAKRLRVESQTPENTYRAVRQRYISEMKDALVEYLSTQNCRAEHWYSKLIDRVWCNGLADEFRRRLDDEDTGAHEASSIWAALHRNSSKLATEIARKRFTALGTGADDDQDVTIAFEALLAQPEIFWEDFTRVLDNNHPVGKSFIEKFVSGVQRKKFLQALEPNQLAFLLRWIGSNIEKSDIGRTSIPKTNLAQFRNNICRALGQKVTSAALNTIDELIEYFEEANDVSLVRKLKFTRIDACKSQRARADEAPLAPDKALRILDDHSARIIRNSKELREVVIESLRRLEKEWRGEPPAVRELWNEPSEKESGGERWEPKYENELSNRLVIFLRRDLDERYDLFVNREVEVAPRVTGTGERIDIQVDAVGSTHSRPNPKLKLMIEVKRSGHSDVRNAMKSQLVDDYLSDDNSTVGLYVVGWYACDETPKTLTTGIDSYGNSAEEWQKGFTRQAEALSDDSNDVKAIVLDASLPESLLTDD